MGFMHVISGFVLFGLLVIVIVAAVIAMLVRMIAGGRPSAQAGEAMDEARMIQELHRGFKRMEQRVETLETLVMDKHARNEEEDGNAPQR